MTINVQCCPTPIMWMEDAGGPVEIVIGGEAGEVIGGEAGEEIGQEGDEE